VPKLDRHPLELPYALSMAAGMRRDELLALRWHDLNRDYTTAHIQTLHPTRSRMIFQDQKRHVPSGWIRAAPSLATAAVADDSATANASSPVAIRWGVCGLMCRRRDAQSFSSRKASTSAAKRLWCWKRKPWAESG
jgi:integrase